MKKLPGNEIDVMELLGKAYNLFLELEELHPADRLEFTHAVHAAQNIVLSREGYRVYRSSNAPVIATRLKPSIILSEGNSNTE